MSTATVEGARRGAPGRISEAERAEIVRLYEAGVPANEIPSRFACSIGTVYAALREKHVPLRRRTRKLTAGEQSMIRDLARAGRSASDIARALDRSPQTIGNFARREGLELVRARRRSRHIETTSSGNGNLRVAPDVRARIVSVARRTGKIHVTAREVGVNRRTVEKVLEYDAPDLLKFRIDRRGHTAAPNPGDGIKRTAGDITSLTGAWREWGLRRASDYDDLVTDYGAEEVALWVAKLSADQRALGKLVRSLRAALDRAGEDRLVS